MKNIKNMKKLTKVVASVMLMGALLMPATEIAAQSRKGAARKTTATTKKTTAQKSQTAPAKAVSLDGNYYEGIIKMAGQPMDLFSTLKFDASNMELNFAGMADFPATYKATEAAGKMSVKLSSNAFSGTFSSKDKGSSLEGTIAMNGQQLKCWFVKVDENHKIPEATDAELLKIVSDPAGYTAFIIGDQNGQKVCFSADMVLNKAAGTYSVTLDNAMAQQLFSNMKGNYSVSDKKLVLEDNNGSQTISGKIYDNGTYIVLPMGSARGMDFSLLMIR